MKTNDLEKRLKELEERKNQIALLYGVNPNKTNKRVRIRRKKDSVKKIKTCKNI